MFWCVKIKNRDNVKFDSRKTIPHLTVRTAFVHNNQSVVQN